MGTSQSTGRRKPESLDQSEFRERFLQRMIKRHPEIGRQRQLELSKIRAQAEATTVSPEDIHEARQLVLETIVNNERPVLFVNDNRIDTNGAMDFGAEAQHLLKLLANSASSIAPVLQHVGRFDVKHFPNTDFLGTGWFVDNDVVVTNRHVASLVAQAGPSRFVFRRGMGGRDIEASICNAHEQSDPANADPSRIFAVKEVLYIEPDSGLHDIAFVRVVRNVNGNSGGFIPIAEKDADDDTEVCVIGYPAKASRRIIPDQATMEKRYGGVYDVKRAAPGYSLGIRDGQLEHDCMTLGGNSGSVVLNFRGQAVGLHFSGLYHTANYGVSATVLRQYISGKRWNQPIQVETSKPSKPRKSSSEVPQQIAPPSAGQSAVVTVRAGGVSVTIPLTITVTVGSQTNLSSPAQYGVADVEKAVLAFWDARPEGVVAARVGYVDDGEKIGDIPCIAASVLPTQMAAVESSALQEFHGVPVRYLPANVQEQIDQMVPESVDSIAYDDSARKGPEFSLEPVNEEMALLLHVGPEYSWDTLKAFLDGAGLDGTGESEKSKKGMLVSAMYEFHATHIKNAIEQRLSNGGAVTLVLDNATFAGDGEGDGNFDRRDVFHRWSQQFDFSDVVAPEGVRGLISDSYHIKVTVRHDDTFWLSSGNWKGESSQPIISQDQRDNATDVDLPGNREWHVLIKNERLAKTYRSHILQDFKRSNELGGTPQPEAAGLDVMVDVAIEEAVELERKPPRRLVEPMPLQKKVRVQPLLTPDREGAVYSEAVLKLIRSATDSLLFQIPYIGMPSNPRDDRGYIDELIDALTKKLKTLRDARVILRSGGSRYSAPPHTAWYFKSKGVDIDQCLRVIQNHHTKGMIVDGQKVLIGSHNWSKPGVTLNRDASLLFNNNDVAKYYTQVFEIDWERSNPVRPRKYVKPESVLEAVGAVPPLGYRRMRLADLLKED